MPLKATNIGDFIKNNRGRILRICVVLFFIASVSYVASCYKFSNIKTFIQQYEQYIILISLALYAVLGATPIPSELLTVFIASFEGPLLALILATFGNTLAALVEFYIGGSIGELSDFEKRKKQLPFHMGDLPIDSPILLLLGRMLPSFGPKFISIICGIYKVPLFTYLWTTVVSNLMGAAIIAYGGYSLIKML